MNVPLLRPCRATKARAAAVVLALGVLAGPLTARAQSNGFMPGAQHATIALSHTLESYDEYWEGGVKIADPSLGKVETGSVSLWMDVGILEDLAITANIAYVDAANDGTSRLAQNGLQDRMFLLRYRALNLQRSSFRHSVVAGVGMRAPAANYDPNSIIALGDGTQDALFRLVYQLQTPWVGGAYFATEFGYDLREEPAPDQSSIYGEIGMTYQRASFGAAMIRTFPDGGFDLNEPGFTFPGLGSEMWRVGGKVYYRVSPVVGLAVSGFTTLDGRNTGVTTGFSTGLVVQI